ncbi:MAG: sugar transferase [Candidatus Omnitrophota bacterium]
MDHAKPGWTVKERKLKRVFDLVFSAICMIVLLPFFLLIAALLKLEGLRNPAYRGPVFWKETRVSRGREFGILKFRTVRADIAKRLEAAGGSVSITSYTGARENLTPVGCLLAKCYFDEWPQIINVLKGEMSLVGPRPHMVSHYENDLKEGIISAKYIKAGIFGLMQASKGNVRMKKTLLRMATKYVSKDKHAVFVDRLYYRHYLTASALEVMMLDIYIIYKCALVCIKAEGVKP